MTRILLINQGHTDNLGDQAIDAVLGKFLNSKGYEVIHAPYETRVEDRFNLRIDNHDLTQRIVMRLPHVMRRLNHTRIRTTLDQIGHVDAAVVGGGELLTGHWGFNAALLAWCQELRSHNIPILLTGVSGNYLGGTNATNYRKALCMCNYVSARDHSTERILREQYDINCDYAPDVVFSYAKVFPEVSSSTQNRAHELCVPIEFDRQLFTTMGITDEKEYIAYLAKQLTTTEKKLPVVVTSTITNDRHYPRIISKHLHDDFGLQTSTQTGESLAGFIQLLQSSTHVVSARMHACILALLFGCHITPVPFREKLKVFGDEYQSIDDIQTVINESYSGLLRLHAAIENAIS